MVPERDDVLRRRRRGPALRGALIPDPVPYQPLDPEPERRREYREGGDRNLAGALSPAPGPGPGEEGQDAAGRADLVAEVEVIGLRVVEVHRTLDQAEPEQAGVEIQVSLRVTRDGGDVMKAEDAGHDTLCACASTNQSHWSIPREISVSTSALSASSSAFISSIPTRTVR